MQTTTSDSGPAGRKIDPTHLGPLDDALAAPDGACKLFPHEPRFFGERALERRVELWRSLARHVDRVLDPGETVLHVAVAHQRTGLSEHLALGYLAPRYHQVALVFTHTRLVEVLLDLQGRRPATRVRSLPWGSVRDLKQKWGRLTVTPNAGKKLAWVVRRRGDRKLLKLLLPRIREQLLSREAGGHHTVPIVHCPECAAVLPVQPTRCAHCSVLMRSPRVAAFLSLAFPGAGLMYVGHPMLAALDFVGESLIFVLVVVSLLVAGNGADLLSVAPVMLLLLGLTKAESIHVGQVLLRRQRTESAGRRRTWQRAGVAGAVVSILALSGAALGTGTLSESIERDLQFAVGDPAWMGTRTQADWQIFSDDPDMRSQWIHQDGWVVSVFAYHLGSTGELAAFHDAFRSEEESQGLHVLMDDDDLPESFKGFRFTSAVVKEAEPYALVYYFVYDPVGKDVHQLLTIVDVRLADQGEQLLRRFLRGSAWIEAVTPT